MVSLPLRISWHLPAPVFVVRTRAYYVAMRSQPSVILRQCSNRLHATSRQLGRNLQTQHGAARFRVLKGYQAGPELAA